MAPSEEWVRRYAQIKDIFVPYGNLPGYFEKPKVAGKNIHVLDIGKIKLPTGQLLVRDPLVYLRGKREEPYFVEAPIGEFSLAIAVAEIEEHHYRYAVARVLFSDEKPVSFAEAMTGKESLDDDFEAGAFFGFSVDAGLASVADVQTQEAYRAFCDRWEEAHPDGNIYDDYFSDLFAQSYNVLPQYQRTAGDWINWTIPGTDLNLPMFASGWGDGTYPVYWAFDEKGQVCQLLIEFINLEYMADFTE
jgi:hypothetical protein